MKPIQILTTVTVSLSLLASSAAPAIAEGSTSRDVMVTAERSAVYVTQLFRRRRRLAKPSAKSQESSTPKTAVPKPTVTATPRPKLAQPTLGNRYQPTSQPPVVTVPTQRQPARTVGSVVVGSNRGRDDFDYRRRFVVRKTVATESQTAQKKTPTEKFPVGVMKSTLSKTSRLSSGVPHPVKLSTGLHSVLVKLNGRSH